MVYKGYFVHNTDLISTARKNVLFKTSDDETMLADQTDSLWDPEGSHLLFVNFTNYNSSPAIPTVSPYKDFLRVNPLTIDAIPLTYRT